MSAEHVVPASTLKQVLLKDIKVPDRFRKDYGDMDAFTESIRDKGILQPITLGPDYTLLAGGRRITGATKAGLEKVPALVRKTTDEIDSREIELIENTFRKDFNWQERVSIVAEIDRLYKEKNISWSGRKTAELLNRSAMNVQRDLELAKAMVILPELADQATASDALKMVKKFEEDMIIEELRKRQTANMDLADVVDGGDEVIGDVQQVLKSGGYSPDMKARLRIAGSNYRIEDTFIGLAEMKSEGMIHLIECDPPYGIALSEVKGSKDSVDSNVHSYEDVPAEAYEAFLEKLCTELYRVAGRDCWLVFWYGPTWHTEVKYALEMAKWEVDDIPAIWVKPQGQTLQPEVYLARCYEPFFLCRKGRPMMAKRGRPNVFQYSPTAAAQKYHPTERPLPLIEEILNTLGLSRQVVLVPFLGSGATLRACYKLNMLGLGFEINPTYKDRFMLAVEEDAKVIVATQPAPQPSSQPETTT